MTPSMEQRTLKLSGKILKEANHLLLGAFLALTLAVAGCGTSEPKELEIVVKLEGDKLSPETIHVRKGDTITLKIEPDRPGRIHLHGYDLEKDLEAGLITEFGFVADATGRFRITFHAAGEKHPSHNEKQPGPDSAGQSGIPESDRGSHEDDQREEVDIGFLEVRPQ